MSNVDSAVADPKTAAGPPHVSAIPGSGYIDLSWDTPTGEFSDTVDAYTVYYNDVRVGAGARR